MDGLNVTLQFLNTDIIITIDFYSLYDHQLQPIFTFEEMAFQIANGSVNVVVGHFEGLKPHGHDASISGSDGSTGSQSDTDLAGFLSDEPDSSVGIRDAFSSWVDPHRVGIGGGRGWSWSWSWSWRWMRV